MLFENACSHCPASPLFTTICFGIDEKHENRCKPPVLLYCNIKKDKGTVLPSDKGTHGDGSSVSDTGTVLPSDKITQIAGMSKEIVDGKP